MSSFGKRTFEVGDRVYEWCGGFGAIIKSYERGVRQGDVRVIGEDTLYAYLVYPSYSLFRPNEVCWTVIKPTPERIHELQRKFFGIA